jgi:hypothetical protein
LSSLSALLGLAGLQLVALRSDTIGHEATMATTLVKTKLTELQKTEQLTEGAGQYVDKTHGMTYDRQWTVHHDQPQTEMTTVRVQLSWRGELSDRAVMVSFMTPHLPAIAEAEGGSLASGPWARGDPNREAANPIKVEGGRLNGDFCHF